MINPESRIARALNIIYEGVVENDYDNVLAIVGDEGKGKTHVMLHIVEEWLTKRYGEVTPEMANKYIGMDGKSFAKCLSGVKRFDIIADDEAADISSRSALEKTNKLFMKAYQIIRGDNLFTILIIPSLFDLDTFFRKRRVRHLIHVYKRGQFAFWNGQRLRRMVEQNERYPVKNYYVVPPLFHDHLTKYEGVLLKPYLKMKEDKMLRVRELLHAEMTAGANKDLLKEAETIKRLKDGLKLSTTQLGEYFNMHRTTIGARLKLLETETEAGV